MQRGWQQTQYQDELQSVLRSIFPRQKLLSNAKKNEITQTTRKLYEVDVSIPELNLCFEFQDFYHYKPAWYNQMPLDVVRQKDDMKRLLLMTNHQTLIAIPCWWIGDAASMKASINFQRPDLRLELTQLDPEIPPNPPLVFFEESMSNSQLMLASFPESNVMDQGSWWIGEKWDGIRCYWDTKDRQLYSRNQVVISLQSRLDCLFGSLVVDAELWCGRGFFGESQALASTFLKSVDASFVRLLCFDEASSSMQSQVFEARYSFVLSNLPENHPTVMNAPRFLCVDDTVLRDVLSAIKTEGGEGLMVRKPLSLYLPGRSASLFKIKAMFMHSDQEALVLKVESDGSLFLQLSNGFTFSVPRDNCLLHQQAVRGDVVSFRVNLPSPLWYRPYRKSTGQEILSDPGSKPVVYRIRSDLSWKEVLQNSSSVPARLTTYVPESSPRAAQNNVLSNGRFWGIVADGRAYFDKFAKLRGMDPLNPIFWYNVVPGDLKRSDQYKAIANKYGPKLSTILRQIYPDIGLQQNQFIVHSMLRKRERARGFFDKFAAAQGMDPLNPIFWYYVTPSELTKYAKSKSNISFSYAIKYNILVQLYPNIGLQQNQFRESRSWLLKSARKGYFDKFAVAKGRDPLNPHSWYTVTPKELMQYNASYKSIAGYYGGKLSKALMHLYPSIGLQQSLFKLQSWKDESDRRKYFDNFAISKGENPRNASFWYGVTTQDLIQYHPGYVNIVRYYDGKLASTLMHLYPDIGLQHSKFKFQSWKRERDRKEFFNKFAASKGSDPLNPQFWYSVTIPDLQQFHNGYINVLKYYDGKLSTALTQLYPEIGLQAYQFKGQSWKHESERKEYFDKFAASKGQDPLNPFFWTNVTTRELQSYHRGYVNIVKHYDWKLSNALVQLYPDIGLHRSHFHTRTAIERIAK